MWFIIFNRNPEDAAGFENYEDAIAEAEQWLKDEDGTDEVTVYEAKPTARVFLPEPTAVVAPL